MSIEYLLITAVSVCGVGVIIFLIKNNISSRKKILGLKKELAIQDSKLDYQKKHNFDSANYYSSTVIIIMEMIQQINSELKSEEGNLLDKILKVICDKAGDLFKPERFVLLTFDTEKKNCSVLCSLGYEQEKLQSLEGALASEDNPLGWSASTGKFLSIYDIGKDPLLTHLGDKNYLKFNYLQPLKVEGKVKAVLCLGPFQYDLQNDIVMRLFSILDNIASVSLGSAVLTEELRELSIRDGLTGLYNHSYFQRWLDGLGKEKTGFLLAIIDLDHFKKVNDTYGHQAGDVILKGISNLLNSLEVDDYMCARYGGEEFALVFKDKKTKDAFSIMEGIRKKVSEQTFKVNGKTIGITISVGVVEANLGSENIDKKGVIEAADKALYEAKATGRNKVILAKNIGG